jgi:hypothetical protein
MKKIKIYGLLLLAIGMLFSSCSNLDESIAIKPTENGTIFSETFALSLGNFSTKNITGSQEWTQNSSGYAGMTGYVNSTYNVNEDWLISPVIDLSSVSAANLSFDYVAHLLNVNTDATLWISETYTNDSIPSASNMTQLPLSLIPDPGNYVFSSTGQISLTQYAGKKIRIAIKYLSSTTTAGTFELKNFLVQKGEAIVNPAVIYAEPLYGNIGKFTTQSVIGAQTWVADTKYSCMTISGYSGSRNANEDWLISSEIDLNNIPESYFTFDHTGNYFSTMSADATVWVSDNYSSGLPATATWVQVYPLNYFNGSAFTWVPSGKISLNIFANKKIHVAFKYTSTTSVAGTWELRNFQVFKGQADGNELLPLKVKDAVAYQSGGIAWVEGYIVGYAWPFMSQFAYFNSPDTCTQKINILLADSTVNIYSTKCLAVQLPRGGIRDSLNMIANKSKFGTKIKIYGVLSPNMGISGLISPTKYTLISTGFTGVATTPTTLFSETFASSLGSFTTNNVIGAQVWKWSSGYGAAMSGFSGTNIANEDWLISPVIDLTTRSSAALSFDHAINKGVVTNMSSEQTLWVTTDVVSATPNWTKIAIPTYPAGNTWNYSNSGEVDLDAYSGMKIKIAFKYTCGTGSSATWEIKNFKIYY